MFRAFGAYDVASELDFAKIDQRNAATFAADIMHVDSPVFQQREVACRNEFTPRRNMQISPRERVMIESAHSDH